MVHRSTDHTIIAIHNHPGSSMPSIQDIRSAKENKYKYGLIGCHNGDIIKYSVSPNSSPEMYGVALAILDRKGYTDTTIREFVDSCRIVGVGVEFL